MLWNQAVFCVEVFIYKRLQMWRHNDVVGRTNIVTSTPCSSSMLRLAVVVGWRVTDNHSWNGFKRFSIEYWQKISLSAARAYYTSVLYCLYRWTLPV